MLWDTRWRNFSIESLAETIDHLCSLASCECGWRARGEDKVAIKINNQSICRSSEKSTAFSSNTKNIWARLLNEFLDMSRVNDWNIESTPFINTNTESNSLCSNCEHCWVVTDENNSPGWGDSGFYHANNVWN